MDILISACPNCERLLEFPRQVEMVVCGVCSTTSHVSVSRGAVKLIPAERRSETDPRVEFLDEEIRELGSEIEELKSKERGAPLQLGCALFGLFGLVVLVLAFFVTVAAPYFGGWAFFLVLGVVVALGIFRMRKKLMNEAQLRELREERSRLEADLSSLEEERDRLQRSEPRSDF